MSLLNEISHELQRADTYGTMSGTVIMHALEHVKQCVKSGKCTPTLLQHINISSSTGVEQSYLSFMPKTSDKSAQYLERDGRKHIIIYDDAIMDIIGRLAEPIDVDDMFSVHSADNLRMKLSELLGGHYDDIVHELVHMTSGIDIGRENAKMRQKVAPFKVRFGADPAESSIDELNNIIAQTRRELYGRSEHESLAYFITGLNRLRNAMANGKYSLPDNESQFTWDFADLFCPEYDQKYDDKLSEIYTELKPVE